MCTKLVNLIVNSPKEYLIFPFGIAHFVPIQAPRKIWSVYARTTVEWQLMKITCLASAGAGVVGGAVWKYISFSKCFWKDLFMEMLLVI